MLVFLFPFSKENFKLYNLDTGPVGASLELLFLEMMSDRQLVSRALPAPPYIHQTVRPYLLFSCGTFDSFLAGLPKWPKNQFKPDQQSRQQALILTVQIYTVAGTTPLPLSLCCILFVQFKNQVLFEGTALQFTLDFHLSFYRS